jgi:hypothetical protein
LKFVQELSGSIVVDFAAEKAVRDLCQCLLDGFWIVQRYGFEPALAGALGNSFGVALVFAVVKSAEAQSAAGGALAVGAIFAPVLAFRCVGDGHLLVGFSCCSPTLCKLFKVSSFAGFRPQLRADKGFRSWPHEPLSVFAQAS